LVRRLKEKLVPGGSDGYLEAFNARLQGKGEGASNLNTRKEVKKEIGGKNKRKFMNTMRATGCPIFV